MEKEKKMDKDLLAAIVYDRSNCYDCAWEAARRVLERSPVDSDAAFVARSIIRTAGAEYLKRHVLDKAMECYRVMVHYCPPAREEDAGDPIEPPAGIELMMESGAGNVPVSTEVNRDIYEVLQALREVEGNEEKSEADLLREGVYQLILKYSADKRIRDLLTHKLESVILEPDRT